MLPALSTWLPTRSFTSPSVDFCSCLSSKNLRIPCLFQRYYAPSREQRPIIGHDQYAGAHLCAPPGMGEELQSHVKIKVSSLPLMRLLCAAPHLPELESFCQDESPQDTPESPPPPPLSLCFSLPVRWTSSQLSVEHPPQTAMISPSLWSIWFAHYAENLVEALLPEPYFHFSYSNPGFER